MGSIIHYWLLSSAVLDVNFPLVTVSFSFFFLSFFFGRGEGVYLKEIQGTCFF